MRKQILAVSIILCLTAIFATAGNVPARAGPATTLPQQLPRPAELERAVDSFLQGMPPGKWLIVGSRTEVVKLGFYEQSLIASETQKLHAALRKNSVIPEVAAMRKMFDQNILVCIVDIKRGASVCKDKGNKDTLLIALYTKVAKSSGLVQSLIVYRRGSVFMPLLADQDQAWYEARSLHELYHAKQDREKAPGSHAPRSSEAFMAEEVEAHSIAKKVLDLQTKGRYSAVVVKIASAKKAKSMMAFVSSITSKDLKAIDSLFSRPSSDEAPNRVTQYILDLTNEWIRKNYSVMTARKMEIDAYLLVTTERK